MTDAALMDAECIHGKVWYECSECEELISANLKELDEDEVRDY